jgi:hypothetical protein
LFAVPVEQQTRAGLEALSRKVGDDAALQLAADAVRAEDLGNDQRVSGVR